MIGRSQNFKAFHVVLTSFAGDPTSEGVGVMGVDVMFVISFIFQLIDQLGMIQDNADGRQCKQRIAESIDKENRSKIAELLAVCSLKNAWVEHVADDIEEVHQGRKDWEWFYKRHCDDRSTFELKFTDCFIKEVYEYFKGK